MTRVTSVFRRYEWHFLRGGFQDLLVIAYLKRLFFILLGRILGLLKRKKGLPELF